MTSLAPIDEARLPVTAPRSQRPRLSILVLSQGDPIELERAMDAMSDAAWNLGAQIVLVRHESQGTERDHIQRIVQHHRAQLAWVGAGSDRSAMTDEGLKVVTGDIVTCREDSRIFDGEWLAPLRRFANTASRRVADVEVTAPPASDRTATRGQERQGRQAHSTRRRIEATSDSIT